MSTARETIEIYIEATRSGNIRTLQSLFAPGALMSGYFKGEFYSGSPDMFFDEIRDNPTPEETGSDYRGDITYVEVIGNTAQITMKEKGYLGADIAIFFHLANIDGKWLILSKTYSDE